MSDGSVSVQTKLYFKKIFKNVFDLASELWLIKEIL